MAQVRISRTIRTITPMLLKLMVQATSILTLTMTMMTADVSMTALIIIISLITMKILMILSPVMAVTRTFIGNENERRIQYVLMKILTTMVAI